MDNLGFDDYVMPLTAFLQRMRASDGRAAVATCGPGNGAQMQVQRAMYAPPPPVQGYDVAMAPVLQATVVSPSVVAYGAGMRHSRVRRLWRRGKLVERHACAGVGHWAFSSS
jgi:hypothetical protein